RVSHVSTTLSAKPRAVAAAWLLERRNPADFALRPPQTFTAEQVAAQVATMAKLILDLLSPRRPKKRI
ncbi:MAG: hypothetical protein GXY83_22650, partial [Rhodopirellula sp.]|nr:hypothetical protein [Rhodopirellula sp.]